MTDNKNDIDLAKEIEELDSFLDEQEESVPLDYDDEDLPPVFESTIDDAKKQGKKSVKSEKKGKAGSGKVIGYFIFIFLLLGAAYAGVVYGPHMIEGPQFNKVKTFVSGNSEDTMQDIVDSFKSYIPTSDKVDKEIVDNTPSTPNIDMSDMSMPINDSDLIDADEVLPVPSDDISEQPAQNISEAVEQAQLAEMAYENTDNESVDNEAMVEEVENVLVGLDIPDDETQIPSEPINLQDKFAMDLEPLETEVIEEAQEISDMPDEELVDMVEEESMATPTELANKTDTPSLMKPVEIATKKAVPVKVSPDPVAKQPVPVKPQDPRLNQARRMLQQNQYQQALNLYVAILADDPADTGALTGRQLAKAKLRLNQIPASSANSSVQAPQVQPSPASSQPVTSNTELPSNRDLNGLLQQTQQNPRDAKLAVKLANAYAIAGDKNQALTWYRKALQIDVIYTGGIDRMAIYDAMADLQ